ncbi:MAG: phage baseplate assembly protein V [Helicobacteraceae bacterium]|nr:phage baseplate assembly protein V [Helicobacteraceae bacterium]
MDDNSNAPKRSRMIATLSFRIRFVPLAVPFAGNNYGVSFLPRANSEVLVGFINVAPRRVAIACASQNQFRKSRSCVKPRRAMYSAVIRFIVLYSPLR